MSSVRSAENGLWSSLTRRTQTGETLLSAGPVPFPRDWTTWVQRAESPAELEALRRSVVRGAPYGSDRWQKQTALRLGLGATLRPRGRPRKEPMP